MIDAMDTTLANTATTGRQGHRTGLGAQPAPSFVGWQAGLCERPSYRNWTGTIAELVADDYAMVYTDHKGTTAVLTNGVGAVEYDGKPGDTMADFATALDGLLGPGAAAAIIHPNRVVHVNGVAMDDPERRVRMTVDLNILSDLIDRNGIELEDDEDFDKADLPVMVRPTSAVDLEALGERLEHFDLLDDPSVGEGSDDLNGIVVGDVDTVVVMACVHDDGPLRDMEIARLAVTDGRVTASDLRRLAWAGTVESFVATYAVDQLWWETPEETVVAARAAIAEMGAVVTPNTAAYGSCDKVMMGAELAYDPVTRTLSITPGIEG